MSARKFAVKAIHEDKLNVKNPSILAKLLTDYAQSLLSKKLKEQRKICNNVYLKETMGTRGRFGMSSVISEKIEYAPEPKNPPL